MGNIVKNRDEHTDAIMLIIRRRDDARDRMESLLNIVGIDQHSREALVETIRTIADDMFRREIREHARGVWDSSNDPNSDWSALTKSAMMQLEHVLDAFRLRNGMPVYPISVLNDALKFVNDFRAECDQGPMHPPWESKSR